MRYAIYKDRGASFARNLYLVLKRKLGVRTSYISAKQIIEGKLKNFDLIFFPGGYPELYLVKLGVKGMKIVRKFIRKGGIYIGSCAGAYFAAKHFQVISCGELPGLNIINVQVMTRYLRLIPGKIEKIVITNKQHFLFEGYKKELSIWYQNGPLITPGKGVETLAKYRSGYGAVVWNKFGKGDVFLFSPHPEGNLMKNIDPEKVGSLNLLRSLIRHYTP